MSDTPIVNLGLGRSARAVSAGVASTCALLDNENVKCWGSNSAALLGTGDTEDRGDEPGEMGDVLAPVALGSNARVRSLAMGSNQACVVLASGAVKCWGLNTYGQLGQGDTAKRGDLPGQMGDALLPIDVGGPTVLVTSGQAFTCAVVAAGGTKCWGENMHGQLGLGDREPRGIKPGQLGIALAPVDLGP